jgi:hypothetical protein
MIMMMMLLLLLLLLLMMMMMMMTTLCRFMEFYVLDHHKACIAELEQGYTTCAGMVDSR